MVKVISAIKKTLGRACRDAEIRRTILMGSSFARGKYYIDGVSGDMCDNFGAKNG